MTRKECLELAMGCVLRDRNNVYGKPEDCFSMIATMWSAYIGCNVSAHDVAAMMALLKIARFRHNPLHEDNAVDCAGYAACMAETATAWEREGEVKADRRFLDGVFGKYGGKCSGNYPENPDSSTEASAEPEFKRGDKVLVTMPDGEDMHCIYVGESKHRGCCCVRYESGDLNGETDDTVPIDQIRREPAPRAEGCEELVQKDLADECEGCLYRLAADAPQTPKETCQRIVDSNPATYGQPRTPTGEELAEMAEEEEKHG